MKYNYIKLRNIHSIQLVKYFLFVFRCMQICRQRMRLSTSLMYISIFHMNRPMHVSSFNKKRYLKVTNNKYNDKTAKPNFNFTENEKLVHCLKKSS